jgi:FdhD protein
MPVSMIDEIPVIKVRAHDRVDTTDELAAEEPLEIKIAYGEEHQQQIKNISVTMRTPGHDAELALGFLFTEGIIKNAKDIATVEHCFIACQENKENVIQVSFHPDVQPDLHNTDRNFYTTSSCGVCGKSSINAIRTVNQYQAEIKDNMQISVDTLYALPELLRELQDVFEQTGGLHASALFSADGRLLLVREDVGRHNALDKLIGAALNKEWLPLNNNILLLSGRASFELIQKAAMAGIRMVVAIGAPSTLAVQLAEEFNITLCGFLRGQRFNIYTSPQRIILT